MNPDPRRIRRVVAEILDHVESVDPAAAETLRQSIRDHGTIWVDADDGRACDIYTGPHLLGQVRYEQFVGTGTSLDEARDIRLEVRRTGADFRRDVERLEHLERLEAEAAAEPDGGPDADELVAQAWAVCELDPDPVGTAQHLAESARRGYERAFWGAVALRWADPGAAPSDGADGAS